MARNMYTIHSVTYTSFFFTYICTSLGSCFSLSFSINICISVGSIITHCTYMCTSVGSCLSVSFFSPLLNTSISVFDYTVTDCKCIGMSLDPRFSLFLSVWVSGYIIGNSAYIRTSLDSYFFLSLFIWMCVAMSDYIIAHMYVSWSVLLTLFFCECFCVRQYRYWLYVYRYVSWSAFFLFFSLFFSFFSFFLLFVFSFSLSLSLCLSQYPGILSVMFRCVNKRDQLTQQVIVL